MTLSQFKKRYEKMTEKQKERPFLVVSQETKESNWESAITILRKIHQVENRVNDAAHELAILLSIAEKILK